MLALILAIAAVLFVLGIGLWVLANQSGKSRARLHGRVSGAHGVASGDVDDNFLRDNSAGIFESLATGGRKIETWMDTGSETSRLFIQAGWRAAEKRTLFYATQAGVPFAGAVTAALLLSSGGFGSALQSGLIATMLVIVSILLPRILLRVRAARRQRAIRFEVPMFIHMLILLFEAGLTTRQAIASLIREGRGVVPQLQLEMLYTLRQMDAGSDSGDAFKQLAEAMEVPELDNVLGVLRQIDRYGGEIREPLTEALHTLEERQVFELREAVNKQSAKMTVVMVLFFLPALLIFVAGPAFVSVMGALAQ